ncbi:dihydrofolate reductase family protein [Spirosoma utsteinense]|uniref:Dihydrofolate reductase n=1 Tax=Spirosoma utsteinense TaxID=2585773 RepID=A0ABR6W8V2_9BACT|nr:dihydrofolate reductase family protein [Spirosoma utsteinense]MBC3786152.1 dihydrofolate reductase [Spirosoma utsteinense]MBC3792342.1 dihydrofolate reductase [Spirosoma utsteinense]
MRKLSLYIAISLDGFIARSDGRVDWLDNVPNPNQLDYGYDAFLASIDTTLMGNNTYKTILSFGGEFPYADKINYVFSRSEQANTTFVRYITSDPVAFVQSLKSSNGGTIWLVGGGQLNTHLLNARLIDELIITVAPIVLGTGIPLFGSHAVETQWAAVRTESFETGLVQSTYSLVSQDTLA